MRNYPQSLEKRSERQRARITEIPTALNAQTFAIRHSSANSRVMAAR
jgi:hypothetical protein